MSLDSYIARELQYIRALAGDLAQKKPQLSAQLGLTAAGESTDPHVKCLLEMFAALTGRIRHKIDDEIPEISDALLNALYPHYLSPVPSMSIVQLKLPPAQADLVAGLNLPGSTELESEETPGGGGACTFRTCSAVHVLPLEATSAVLQQRRAALVGLNRDANGLLRIVLQRPAAKPVSALKFQRLRFHITGQDQYIFALYELILAGTIDISVSKNEDGSLPQFLGAKVLTPAGFDTADAIIPPDPRTFPGYRLLSEYFLFPRKFLFFDVDLSQVPLAEFGQFFTLQFHLEKSADDIEPYVNAATFKLGCTPIVNLTSRDAEPVALTHLRTEYPIEVYSPGNQAYEVYEVQEVKAVSPDSNIEDYQPFYSVRHGASAGRDRFWYAARRPAQPRDGLRPVGTDVFLSLVDLQLQTANPADYTLKTKVVCTNRDLPKLLPNGEDRPRFQLVKGGPIVRTLVSPTPPVRPELGRGAVWGLISHLLLNHLSLSAPGAGAQLLNRANDDELKKTAVPLKEILQLYNIGRSPEVSTKIDSIRCFLSEHTTARAGGAAAGGFCRGVRLTIELDDGGFPDRSTYLFAAVLERFIGLYVSINSFSQLVARAKPRDGVLKTWKWPPRAGQLTLL